MANVNSSTGSSSPAEIFAALNGGSGVSTKPSASASQDMASNFLTMLTTQLRNQDPLNPLDNAQITSQLAQINTVNGIEKLNTTVAKLLTAYDETQTMQAASLIGQAVMVRGNSLNLANGQALGGIKLDGAADNVVVTISDATGNVIQSESLGPHKAGIFNFLWDGKNAAGNAMPAGSYKFSVSATQAGVKVNATALNAGTVSALTRSGNTFVLDLGTMGSASFDDVQQIL